MQQTPPMGLKDVMSEWDNYKKQTGDNLDLEQFAAMQDAKEGTDIRKSAYHVNMLQRLNNFLGDVSSAVARVPITNDYGMPGDVPVQQDPRMQEFQQQQMDKYIQGGVPETSAAGLAGRGMSEIAPLVGYPELAPDFQKIGEEAMISTPRTMAPMLTGPAALPLMTADSMLQAYSGAKERGAGPVETIGDTAIAGGTMLAMPTMGKVGGEAVGNLLAKTPISNMLIQRGAEEFGSQAGMLATMTAGKAAHGINQGNLDQVAQEQVTPQGIASDVAGLVPFLPMSLQHTLSGKPVDVQTPQGKFQVDMPTYTEQARARAASAAETTRQQEVAQGLDSKLQTFLSEQPSYDFTQPDVAAQFSQKSKDFIEALSPEEYANLTPLMFRTPGPTEDANLKAARMQFQQEAFAPEVAASMVDVVARTKAKQHPDVTRLWKEYQTIQKEWANTPDSAEAAKLQQRLEEKINEVEARQNDLAKEYRLQESQSRVNSIEQAAKVAGVENTPEYLQAKKYFAESGNWAPMQEVITKQSPEQRAFFAQSTNPNLVYHYTPNTDFKAFAKTQDFGFHFGDFDAAVARRANENPNGGGRILAGYINAQNPLRLKDLGDWDLPKLGAHLEQRLVETKGQEFVNRPDIQELLRDVRGEDTGNDFGGTPEDFIEFNPVRKLLEAAGYDSVIYRNTVEGKGDSYIALRPEQFKSVENMKPTNDPRFDFSLTSPSGDIDLSSPKSATPEAVLEALTTGRLVPTGVPGNEATIQRYNDLMSALVKPAKNFANGGRDFDNEKRLLRLGALYKATGLEGMAPDSQKEWNALSSQEKQTAVMLRNIWENPTKALSLTSDKWAVNAQQPLMQARAKLNLGAASFMVQNEAPIGTPAEMGKLVRTGNQYVDQVVDFLNQNGYDRAKVLKDYGTALEPITPDWLTEVFERELPNGGLYPQAEAISRVIEAVKSRVLFARQLATNVLDKIEARDRATRPEMRDISRDAEFNSKLQGLPHWFQGLVGMYYGKAGEVYQDKTDQNVWRLDNFRKEVGEALANLTPEARAQLEAIKPQGEFNPMEYSGIKRRAAKINEVADTDQTSGQQKRIQEEEGVKDLIGDRVNNDDTEEAMALQNENAAQNKIDLNKLRDQTQVLERYQGELEKIPVRYEHQVGDQNVAVTSNLWDILSKDHPPSRVEAGSERREQDMPADSSEPELTQDQIEEAQVQRPRSEERAEDPNAPRDTQVEQDILARYFEGKQPEDPREALKTLPPLDLQMKYAEVFGAKSFSAKLKKITDSGYMEKGIDGTQALTNFIRDAVDADMQADTEKGAQRQITEAQKAVIEKYFKMPYNEWAKEKKNDWNAFFRDKVGTGVASTFRPQMAAFKALLGGMRPKAGVDLAKIGEEYKKTKAAAKKSKFNYNVEEALRTEALRRGLSEQWINDMLPTMERMMKPFAYIQNAEFAMIANPKEAFTNAAELAKVLGLSIPTNSIVEGKVVKNPILAANFQEILNTFKYKDAAAFWMTTTVAHEALHAFVNEIVKHPEKQQPFHIKVQVQQYLNLLTRIHGMTPEDRVAFATTAMDTMLPDSRTREVLPDGSSRMLPEYQGLIRHAVNDPEEMAAFIYQLSVASMARDSISDKSPMSAAREQQDKMQWLDDDVRDFIRGQYRNLADFTDVIQSSLSNPDFRAAQGYQASIGKYTMDEAGKEKKSRTMKVDMPETAGVKFQVKDIVSAAQAIGEMDKVIQAAPKYQEPLTNTVIARQLAKMEKTLIEVQSQMEYMDAMLKGSTSLEEAAKPEGIRVINPADVLGDKQMSQITGVQPTPQKNSQNAINGAAKWFSGFGVSDDKYRQNVVMRYMALMPQRLNYLSQAGLTLARDVSFTLNWQPTAHSLRDNAYAPLTKRDGRLGQVTPDKAKAWWELAFQGKNGKVDVESRKAVSDIIRALQPVSNEDNKLTSQYAQDLISKNIQKLPKEKQVKVAEFLNDYFQVTRYVLAQQLKANEDTQASIIGHLMQATNKGKVDWRTAQSLGYKLISQVELMQRATDPKAPDPRALQELQQVNAELAQITQQLQLDPKTLEYGTNVAIDGQAMLSRQRKMLMSGRNWAPEQRYGRYLVSWKEGEERGTFGFGSEMEAKHFVSKIAKEGKTDINVHDTYAWSDQARLAQAFLGSMDYEAEMRTAFDRQLDKIRQIQSAGDPTFGTRIADIINEGFNPFAELAKQMATSQIDKNFMQRQYKPGREYIDYVDNLHNYVLKTTQALARQSSRNRLNLQLQQLNDMSETGLASDVKRHFHEIITPEAPATRIIRQLVAGKSLALNIPNAVIELTQPMQTGVPVLIREGLGIKDAYKTFGRAAERLTRGYLSEGPDSLKQQAIDASAKQLKGLKLTKDEELALYFRRFYDEHRLETNPVADDIVEDADVKNVNIARPRFAELDWKDKAQVMGENTVGAAVNSMQWLSGVRNKITKYTQMLNGYAALEAGYRKGLRGESLYSYAASLIPVMGLTGGRFVRPFGTTAITEKNNFVRNSFGSFYVMQNFAIGLTSMLAKDAHDSLMGKTTGLSPQEVANARKSLGQTLAVTTALGGALGVPGVAAVFALIQKLFGVDPEAAVREMTFAAGNKIGDLLGSDDNVGYMLSDLAANGAVNHFSGIDFASRAGVSNLFGFNATDGFTVGDVLGPTGSAIKDVYNSVQLVSSGDQMKAAIRMAPSGLKPLLRGGQSLYDYGDVRIMDSNSNLVAKPDTVQALAYSLFGFQPANVVAKNREIQLLKRGEDVAKSKQDQLVQDMARSLLSGDPSTPLNYAYNRQFDTDFNPRNFIDSVLEKALDMQNPKDSLDSGLLGTSQDRMALARTFNTTPSSAMERLQQKQLLLGQMGYPFGSQPASMNDFVRANLIDQLVQSRGVTRQEATRIVQQQGF